VSGVPCATLAGLGRGHGRSGHIPLMICGKPKQTAGLRTLGIDDLMRDSAEPHLVAQRIRERVQRFRDLPFAQHLPSGVSNRVGVLHALDLELRRARRDRHVITVGMLQVDGLARVDAAEQHQVAIRLRQALVRAVDQHLRRTDSAGELLPGSFLFVLPSATRVQAEPRLTDLSKALSAAIASDPLLGGLTQRLGLADTEAALLGVAGRAESDLS